MYLVAFEDELGGDDDRNVSAAPGCDEMPETLAHERSRATPLRRSRCQLLRCTRPFSIRLPTVAVDRAPAAGLCGECPKLLWNFPANEIATSHNLSRRQVERQIRITPARGRRRRSLLGRRRRSLLDRRRPPVVVAPGGPRPSWRLTSVHDEGSRQGQARAGPQLRGRADPGDRPGRRPDQGAAHGHLRHRPAHLRLGRAGRRRTSRSRSSSATSSSARSSSSAPTSTSSPSATS